MDQDFSWFFSVLVLGCLSWSCLGFIFWSWFLAFYQKFLIDEMSLMKTLDLIMEWKKFIYNGMEEIWPLALPKFSKFSPAAQEKEDFWLLGLHNSQNFRLRRWKDVARESKDVARGSISSRANVRCRQNFGFTL